jgi:hypothetical protein
MSVAGHKIDIIVTHGYVTNRFQFGTAVQEILVDGLGKGDKGAILIGESPGQLLSEENPVFLIG